MASFRRAADRDRRASIEESLRTAVSDAISSALSRAGSRGVKLGRSLAEVAGEMKVTNTPLRLARYVLYSFNRTHCIKWEFRPKRMRGLGYGRKCTLRSAQNAGTLPIDLIIILTCVIILTWCRHDVNIYSTLSLV